MEAVKMTTLMKAMKRISRKRSQHDREKIGLSEKARTALEAMTVIDDMIDEQEGIDYDR
jgi:hypothetical protein